jgi:hypothetical protein
VEGVRGRREPPVRVADRGKGSGETGRFPQLICKPNREFPPEKRSGAYRTAKPDNPSGSSLKTSTDST